MPTGVFVSAEDLIDSLLALCGYVTLNRRVIYPYYYIISIENPSPVTPPVATY